MSQDTPAAPVWSGKHPILMVVLSANDLAASTAFYARLFGWQTYPMSAELVAAVAPAGPSVTLRARTAEGFQGMVPFLSVTDPAATLERVVAAGGSIEREPWDVPMIGRVARFRDPSGTVYGLTSAVVPDSIPRLPTPLGGNPKPPAGTVCGLEMYTADSTGAARFFGELFGWGTQSTMPPYLSFDPGAGIGGVFQSHTPTLPAVAYIYVEDVAAKLTEIDAEGGKRIGEPMPVPGAGCFGYFHDPSGTTMGLIGP